MYIEKYWYNYIGGTDDSLTLVDYIYDKGKNEILLSEIFSDTGLSKLSWNFRTSSNLEYIDSQGKCHDFYYAIDLVTDLAALILESKKSGGFNIKNLFDGETRELFVKIITTSEEDQAINGALAEFFASPLEYDLHEMVDDEDMLEMAKDCENIRKELCE
ncbi:MAG: imm68 putative immunity domain-containing protein [Faecalibacterium sp.]